VTIVSEQQQIQEVNMKKVVFALGLMGIVATGASALMTDAAPTAGIQHPGEGTFPILFVIPMDINAYCVGVGYDGTNFWVSAGDQATAVCEFYIWDEYGNMIDNVPQGGGASGWGHRDMCWNGSYMFGSYSNLVDGFGPDYMFAGYFIGCLNPNRAMAYDGTCYYTGGFGDQMTRMTWDGNFGSAASCDFLGSWDGTYGLAYDYVDDVLYMSLADYSGDLHMMTTDGFLLDTYTTLPEYDIHGGCTMACTAQFGYILCVLMQSSPDSLVFYDLGHGPSAADTGSWGSIKAMFR
jgi:hypothetical protein